MACFVGNYAQLAVRGAVIAIEIKWDCDLDFDFMRHCLPKYAFHILDDSGWNFRHALYHEENRRTLIKAYGMKFLINVNGNAGQFDITKTVVIIVTGLGLIGLANILCDIVLLKSSNRYREQIAEKKYEAVHINESESMVMNGLGLGRSIAMKILENPKTRNVQAEAEVTATTNTAESTPSVNRNKRLEIQEGSLLDS